MKRIFLLLTVAALIAFGSIEVTYKVFAQASNSTTPILGLSNGFQAGAMTQNDQLNTNFTKLDGALLSSGQNSLTLGTTGTTAGSLKFFNASTGSITLQPATGTLGTVTATFPAASITVPGTILTDCGSSATCASPTTRSSIMKVAVGKIAFSSATTASVSGISPTFTATADYACVAMDPSNAYTWTISNTGTGAFTITAGTSNSDTWSYVCTGY